MPINKYLIQISKRFESGISKEHSYRGDLEGLLREITQGVEITNEPANVTNCGNPDYVITKGEIPIGYIEAKDIGKDLNSNTYNEQFNRYKSALDNLIITDYLWFQFYQSGELVHEIKIADINSGKIVPLPENYKVFRNLINEFCSFTGQTIKSPKKLAEMMASKARLLENILEQVLTSDEDSRENTLLKDQYESFRQILINELKPQEFADIYAQTLAYGMFAARLHDTTLDEFTRQEAAELIPKTNPFLRKLFQYVGGYDIDNRIKTTVDNLAEVFRATDVASLINNFGKRTQTTDPIIHFYETFLSVYDPEIRKARGVFYTPEPVVTFIVKAVDDILNTEFGLSDGLADTSKTKIQKEITGFTKGKKKRKAAFEEVDVHKVQILDPATGTGTFLAEIMKYIYNKKFQAMQGAWSGYVEEHLIPRLNGFELLMASYSMAHLKLDLLLTQTGYTPTKDQRFNIYLTNTLEEHHPDTGTLFASWLSTEANEANYIKRDTPVMVVLGNPPYSVSSNNKGEWIQELLTDYKKGLNERKINLDDDYIKFIRYGHHFIDKTGEGILAYISSNSFLSGVTHRRMRKHLMESFDKIYILDLHGNSKQHETSPDGSVDQNVFDITQGVSINIFVKTNNNQTRKNAEVFHKDIYGFRKDKYETLISKELSTIDWKKLKPTKPYYFFTSNHNHSQRKYQKGFSVNDLFINKNTGIQTKNDRLAIRYTYTEIENVINDFINLSEEDLKNNYEVKEGTWTISKAKQDLLTNNYTITPILFKPFDIRYTALTQKSGGFLGRPRYMTMRHMLPQDNLALLVSRQNKSNTIDSFLVTQYISEMKSAERTIQSYHLPLYTYIEEDGTLSNLKREPNLSSDIVKKIGEYLDLEFSSEKIVKKNTFNPIDILDYIYAVLYSPNYRDKYKEILKIEFPRVPYPKSKKLFWKLVDLGGELRQIHLMKHSKLENFITQYPKDGDNKITRRIIKKDWEIIDDQRQLGRIWLNDDQYFDDIPLEVWEFYIGGYQPAQKWLKDRVGKQLGYDDILHYQKVIVAINETKRIMKQLDELVEF